MSKSQNFFMGRRAALVLCTAGLILGLHGTGLAAEQAGAVTEVVGTATASARGKTRTLAVRETVVVGDLIKTAAQARLSLLLGGRTKLRLGEDAELRIDQYIKNAGGELHFARGTIMFNSGGDGVDNNLRFKTPYGLLAVRGTIFYAGPSGGVFGVFVRSGHVEVSAGGETVRLGPREGTDIASPGAHPTKPVIWKPARVREIIAQVR